MNPRPSSRRAHARLITLVAVAVGLLALLPLRDAKSWHGVALGDTETKAVAALGEASERFECGGFAMLTYTNERIYLRAGIVYAIDLTGDAAWLKTQCVFHMGLPLASEGGNADWVVDGVAVRLSGDRLSVWAR